MSLSWANETAEVYEAAEGLPRLIGRDLCKALEALHISVEYQQNPKAVSFDLNKYLPDESTVPCEHLMRWLLSASTTRCGTWNLWSKSNWRLRQIVALLIGTGLALSVGVFATVIGLDRDRGFYPVVTIVIAAYYVLFAVMGASPHGMLMESLVCGVFVGLAVAGFKWSLWIVVVALAGHGVLDLTHASIISNPGVPSWWPEFCLTYDVSAAAYLAFALKRGRIRAAG
jgi:hypothetical protein